jgi:hypothetical protein
MLKFILVLTSIKCKYILVLLNFWLDWLSEVQDTCTRILRHLLPKKCAPQPKQAQHGIGAWRRVLRLVTSASPSIFETAKE